MNTLLAVFGTAERNDVILTKRIRVLNNRRRTEKQSEPLVIFDVQAVVVITAVVVDSDTNTSLHIGVTVNSARGIWTTMCIERRIRIRFYCGMVWMPFVCTYTESFSAVRVYERIELNLKIKHCFKPRSLANSKGMHWKVLKKHIFEYHVCVWGVNVCMWRWISITQPPSI